MDTLNISNPRAVTCLWPRPSNGVRLPGGGPGALPLLGRSQRAWPRLEPSAHLSSLLQSLPRWPLSRRPGDLSCPSSLCSCLIADALRLLIPLAGLINRQLAPGGRGGERSGDQATSSLRRLPLPAPRAAIGWPALARFRFRLAGRPSRGPRPHARCALASTHHSRRGGSGGRSQL